jgi:hypothetical protein
MQAGFTREPIGHFQGAKETMPGNITSADNSPLRHTVSEKGGEANVDIPASMMKRNR